MLSNSHRMMDVVVLPLCVLALTCTSINAATANHLFETHDSLKAPPAGAVELLSGNYQSVMLDTPCPFRVFSPVAPKWPAMKGEDRIALLASFGANAKPYLPQLKAAIENELESEAESEGFTKDVPLSKPQIAKVVQEIELALQKIEKNPNAPKIITVEEAKQIGLKALEQKE